VGTQTYDCDAGLTSQAAKNSSGAELSKITYGWSKGDNLTTKPWVSRSDATARIAASGRTARTCTFRAWRSC